MGLFDKRLPRPLLPQLEEGDDRFGRSGLLVDSVSEISLFDIEPQRLMWDINSHDLCRRTLYFDTEVFIPSFLPGIHKVTLHEIRLSPFGIEIKVWIPCTDSYRREQKLKWTSITIHDHPQKTKKGTSLLRLNNRGTYYNKSSEYFWGNWELSVFCEGPLVFVHENSIYDYESYRVKRSPSWVIPNNHEVGTLRSRKICHKSLREYKNIPFWSPFTFLLLEDLV